MRDLREREGDERSADRGVVSGLTREYSRLRTQDSELGSHPFPSYSRFKTVDRQKRFLDRWTDGQTFRSIFSTQLAKNLAVQFWRALPSHRDNSKGGVAS